MLPFSHPKHFVGSVLYLESLLFNLCVQVFHSCSQCSHFLTLWREREREGGRERGRERERERERESEWERNWISCYTVSLVSRWQCCESYCSMHPSVAILYKYIHCMYLTNLVIHPQHLEGVCVCMWEREREREIMYTHVHVYVCFW